jgi:hypothetical protein
MRTINVYVTRKDILEGKCMAYSCPIALAVNRALKRSGYAHYECTVNQININIYYGKNLLFHRIEPPYKCAHFINMFDSFLEEDKKQAKPFKFSFQIPDPIEVKNVFSKD